MKSLFNMITIFVLVMQMFTQISDSFPVESRNITTGNDPAMEAIAHGNRILTQVQFRLQDTVSEVEWLLQQLVNILTEMVNGIEEDPTMLHNRNFRLILVQVIKRIDYILEHFEEVGPELSSSSTLQFELGRIDCIRIRLINYVSQSNRYDDSNCRRTTASTPSSSHESTGSHQHSHKEMLPVLTQIVSLLNRISNQLMVIEREIHHGHGSHHGNHPAAGSESTTRPLTRAPSSRRPGTTIDWDAILGTTARPGGSMIMAGQTESSEANSATTQDWNQLISQVMDGMGGTLRPETTTADPPSGSTTADPPSSNTTLAIGGLFTTISNRNWEDLMNDLIQQWNRQPGQRN